VKSWVQTPGKEKKYQANKAGCGGTSLGPSYSGGRESELAWENDKTFSEKQTKYKDQEPGLIVEALSSIPSIAKKKNKTTKT
jgi:hypothetical protein